MLAICRARHGLRTLPNPGNGRIPENCWPRKLTGTAGVRPPAQAYGPREVFGPRVIHSRAKTRSAASSVASMTAWSWVAETNPASKAEGAKWMPSASMP